ncbi:unnamed protein product [Calypogeia fissa]
MTENIQKVFPDDAKHHTRVEANGVNKEDKGVEICCNIGEELSISIPLLFSESPYIKSRYKVNLIPPSTPRWDLVRTSFEEATSFEETRECLGSKEFLREAIEDASPGSGEFSGKASPGVEENSGYEASLWEFPGEASPGEFMGEKEEFPEEASPGEFMGEKEYFTFDKAIPDTIDFGE